MKLTIFLLATDCDMGTQSEVFANKIARDDALLSWCGSSREEWLDHPTLADDLHEYVQTKTDHLDTFSTDEVELEIDDTTAWHAIKKSAGSFGVLYDPIEIATMTDGWSDENEEDATSHYFDTNDPSDMAALTAWCEAEKASFEDAMSSVVHESAPTRAEAFKALAKVNDEDAVAA